MSAPPDGGTLPPPDVWPRPEGGASNDLAAFEAEFAAIATARGFAPERLGDALGHAITRWQRPADAAPDGAPRLLIASGFHGNESAGPWGLVLALRLLPQALLARVHLSLLPLVSGSGFTAGRRLNALGQNPNRGMGGHGGAHAPSAEGEVLLRHGERLAAAARDGVLACHEDLTRPWAYVYSFEPQATPGPFSQCLVAAGARWFTLAPDGDVDGCTVRGGLIHNHFDGSFECWMTECGAAVAACIETPGRADFARRTQAQAAMVLEFLAQRAPG
ncbi:hypothetical protein AACH10_11550 [Ideonella sp. DXS22W]|uniref:Uncharacterized protein n=1 Tax=Pseudaquabacterium inlustre TaxID=2984192 RepID=A0ABU9CJZ4_9BURK